MRWDNCENSTLSCLAKFRRVIWSWRFATAGLDVLPAQVRSRVCFFGHHHTRVDAGVSGVRCTGLNKIAMPGNLVAMDMERGQAGLVAPGEFSRDEESM